MRNLKVRYRKSIFGFLWTLLVPAAMALVYVFVFKYIARIGGPSYALFILSTVIPWTFFSTSLLTGTESLVNNFGILSKVPIAISVFPLSETCSAFVNLLFSMPILLSVAMFFDVYPTWSWTLLPFIFLLLFLQTFALAVILAISNVYLRDVRHLVTIIVQIWMYLTPVLYNIDLIPPEFLHWFYLNPLFFVFDSVHTIFIMGGFPSKFAFMHMFGWSIGLILMAYFVNQVYRSRLVEKL